MKLTSYNPHPDLRRDRFGLFRFRSPLLTEYLLVFFPPGTEMFYFPGYAPCTIRCRVSCKHEGFPHSEISGSKVARHLPEAYRRHATSFIAISSQGIHHTPLNFLLGNSKTTFLTFILSCRMRPLSLQHFRHPLTTRKDPEGTKVVVAFICQSAQYVLKEKSPFGEAG